MYSKQVLQETVYNSHTDKHIFSHFSRSTQATGYSTSHFAIDF
jgi:hypothetical protein